MSIIYDALKKVQSKIDKHSKGKTVPYTLSEDTAILPPPRIPKSFLNPILQPAAPFRDTQHNVAIPAVTTTPTAALGLPGQKQYQKILIVLCSLICGILILLISYLFFLFGIIHPDSALEGRNPEQIVLQGIVTKDDKNVALINDEIYEVGETVMGKKILQIGVNSIQIQDHWKIKTLYVKQKPN